MINRILKTLFLTTVCFSSWGQTQYVSEQWQLIPRRYRVSIPKQNFEMLPKDQEMLEIRQDPIARNKYITQRYHQIGERLRACLGGENIGNWYHFAVWASREALEVINGSKFKNLSLQKRRLHNIAAWLRIVGSERKLKRVFAYTNVVVALEMIPVGEALLKTFCQGGGARFRNIDIDRFLSSFPSVTVEERFLKKAMIHYAQAFVDDNRMRKYEHIALASIYQVFSEQTRVQKLIKMAFKFRFLFSKYYRITATAMSGFALRGEMPLVLKLDAPIPSSYAKSVFMNPQLTPLRDIYTEYGRPIPLDSLWFQNSACLDWSKLNCRMRYLSALFPALITYPGLFSRP